MEEQGLNHSMTENRSVVVNAAEVDCVAGNSSARQVVMRGEASRRWSTVGMMQGLVGSRLGDMRPGIVVDDIGSRWLLPNRPSIMSAS